MSHRPQDYAKRGGQTGKPKPHGLFKGERANPTGRIRSRTAPEDHDLFNDSTEEKTDTGVDDRVQQYESQQDEAKRKVKKPWQRTDVHLSVIITICVILIVVLVVFAFVFHYHRKASKTCTSSNCIVMTKDILTKMDLTVKPCDDFYQYACGNYTRDPLIPPGKEVWSIFDKAKHYVDSILKRLLDEPGSRYLGYHSTAIQKAKLYYKACLNTTATHELGKVPMQMLIRGIGSWPLISDDTMGTWDEESWSLEFNLARANLLGGGGPFKLDVSTDSLDRSIYILKVDQSGLSFEHYNYYLGNQSSKYHQLFVEYVEGVTTLLGASSAKSQQAAEELWQFEANLAEFFVKDEDRHDPRSLYNKMTLQDLQDGYFGQFNLYTYLGELYMAEIPMTEEIVVLTPTYFEKMADLLKRTPNEVLANYLVWQTVHGMMEFMPEPFTIILNKVKYALDDATSDLPRWEVCVDRTQKMLGFATGGLYVDRYFRDSDKEEIKSLVSYITAAFKESLSEVSWMDQFTISRALDKLHGTKIKLAYPSFIKSPGQLDLYYAKLELGENKQFHNQLAANMFRANQILSRRGVMVDRTRWDIGPATVTAYYNNEFNEMVLPAALLQNPFYDSRFPMALKFGSLGSIIARELTHGFDKQGSAFDENGNLFKWWTSETIKRFSHRTSCFVKQYNAFPVENSHVNGSTTLHENLADNGGVKIAFDAYVNWLSDNNWKDPTVHLPALNMRKQQLFLLGYAQNWCTYYTPEYAVESLGSSPTAYAKYRVIGPLSNFDRFSTAFGCKLGSNCTVW